MLPPPMTMASWTSSSLMSLISLAIASQVSGEMPCSRVPSNASPLNFNITRRYFGCGAEVVVIRCFYTLSPLFASPPTTRLPLSFQTCRESRTHLLLRLPQLTRVGILCVDGHEEGHGNPVRTARHSHLRDSWPEDHARCRLGGGLWS